jgi:YidC/Oxa1 family membrane protein insertase
MYGIYSVVKDYGVALILFTVLVKLLLFPISYKQQKNIVKQQALAPKLEKLKKSFANNQERYNEEQMKLYAEEGINPMASCLPMMIQLVLIYGILDVVYRPLTHILRLSKDTIATATSALQTYIDANDLTVKDFSSRPELAILRYVQSNPEIFPTEVVEKIGGFRNTLFGVIDLGQIPTIHPDVWNASAVCLLLIPILSGVFQLILTIYSQARTRKMNPDTSQMMGGMNIMLYCMPLFSVWIAFSFPAGVGFYWAISSLCSLIQTVFLYTYFNEERSAKILAKDKAKYHEQRKKSGKQSFMDKMLEQQRAMNGENSKSKDEVVHKSYDERDNEKLSRSKMNDINKKKIEEARKRMAEKYGDDYDND